ncbi:FtsX-like permease family protein [Nocardioides sp. AE5]|uniref:FtsX-like permease family protein n=1 Tax=Nocardioides sp. AE5 TaxID=2962573 RepID=UPI0028828117|nr:FtsX-like permease family protein [Nocardioides sp. AE5]MDT0200519.1 FtsX-like permease family protein [Nocardioides sp. AE5]
MRTVLVASLRRNTRRYVAAVVAVVIGVAFIVTTNALASAARNGMVSGLDAPFRNADVVVSDIDGQTARDLLQRAEREGARAAILGWAWLPVTEDGDEIASDADVGAIADDESMRWQVLTSGRFPTSDTEAVVDTNAAKSNGIVIGDEIVLGTGRTALTVHVVGMVDSPSSMVWTSAYVTEQALDRWLDQAYVNSVAWAGSGSTSHQIAALESAYPEATVQSSDDFVNDQHQAATQGVNVLAMVLLLFASVALLTSAMVIANTFSILFAQRLRDFALLRCVGATRRQVLGSIRLEALVVGVVAATLGLAVGAGIGFGLVEIVQRLAPGARMGDAALSPLWCGAAFATGVLITLGAGWLPTRRAVRVSPLAALRPDTGIDARTTAGRTQVALGVLLLAAGIAALALAVAGQLVPVMVLGGVTTSLGVVVLGPVIVPALLRLVGAAAARVVPEQARPAARLAAHNAVRNPRRTAATTASLMVGVTLTTAVLTGLASARSIVADEMDNDHPIDVAVTAPGEDGLDPGTLEAAGRLADVKSVAAIPGTVGSLGPDLGEVPVLAPDAAAAGVLRSSPAFAAPNPSAIFLPWSVVEGLGEVPDEVTLTVAGRSRTLRVNLGDDWGNAVLVAPETLADLTDAPAVQAVWLRTDLAADASDADGDIKAIAGNAEVASALEKREYVALQIDVLTGAVVGLLGIAVIIALVGIANTLGLSVLERGRENALLRAMGLTRGQLRTTLAAEAMLLSVVATLVGTVVGVAFAWVGVRTMLSQFTEGLAMTLPVGQLVLVVLISALAGLAACVLPARRAARVTPAAGLAMD